MSQTEDVTREAFWSEWESAMSASVLAERSKWKRGSAEFSAREAARRLVEARSLRDLPERERPERWKFSVDALFSEYRRELSYSKGAQAEADRLLALAEVAEAREARCG